MKPLIVGEAPGKGGDPTKPIEGRIGARLADCCDLTMAEFLATFDRVNLLQVQPQDGGKGATFNVQEARRVAYSMTQHSDWPGRLALILGKRAGAAFGFVQVDYFQKMALYGAIVYVVPHPSGLNRWWNDPENELQMMRFMRELIEGLHG